MDIEVRPAGMVIEFGFVHGMLNASEQRSPEPFGPGRHDIARTDTPRRNAPRYGIDAAPKTNSLVLTL